MKGRKPKPTKVMSPAPAGHGDFWATVHVKFHAPIPFVDDPAEPPIHGYYRCFGIRAIPRRVQVVIEESVDDGAVDWSNTEWHLVDPLSLDKPVRVRITDVTGEGVWYMSGRIMYPDPDLDPRPS